jgi:hypothetical protein
MSNPSLSGKVSSQKYESRTAWRFHDADACVVHHNTKQLKFTPGSTGFSD